MNNKEIAKLLNKVAAAYILKDEAKYRFQIIAYQKATEAVEKSTSEVKDLWDDGKITSVPGIGPSITQHLDELFKKGKVKHFKDLFKNIPPATFALLEIPGMGPKKAFKLVAKLKIKKAENAVFELQKAALNHKISPIEGFGEKSEQDIIRNIDAFLKGQTKSNRMSLPLAHAVSQEIINYLKQLPEAVKIEPLGSLRRMVATIGDVDIAVASHNIQKILDFFCQYPKVKRILEKGDHTASIILQNGHQVDLIVHSPEGFGSLLQHFTGSKQHNIHLREYALKRGLSLSEYGIKTNKKVQSSLQQSPRQAKFKIQSFNSKLKIYQFGNEKDFYRALDLAWIPPELREDTGEIEASLRQAQGKQSGLPDLVELRDIKGDLHIHSNYDIEPSHDFGENSMNEMVDEGKRLGYDYLAFSEHSPSISNHNNNQIHSILIRRKEYIEQLVNASEKHSEKRTIKLFNSLEVDILSSGKLSISDKDLETLDFYIVSIHSSFKQNKKDMTKRIINGLAHKKAKILGHPTGRLLNKRDGYEIDWDTIFDFCLKNNKALEINSFPDRLDLPDILVREAVNNGIKLVINTDSHAKDQMKLMFYGISVARRGWAKPSDIINTMPYNEFVQWTKL